MKRVLTIFLVLALCLSAVSCEADARGHDERRTCLLLGSAGSGAEAQMDFASALFRKTAEAEGYENVLISPLSVTVALAVMANGAAGETRSQMEDALGGLAVEELNVFLSEYIKNLPCGEDYQLHAANSVWTREGALSLKEDFLQTGAAYYDAALYERPFDKTTVDEINAWVAEHTDHMIKNVVSDIDEASILYLINAICFDAAWQKPYSEHAVRNHDFMNIDGNTTTVDMMFSREDLYISDNNTTGFLKNYADGKYQFVALLPDEDVDFEDYVSSLTSEKLTDLLARAEDIPVDAGLPKFEYEFEIRLPAILAEMGMTDAFTSRADFSNLSATPVFVNDVLHKTFISVTEERTKASALTVIQAYGTNAAPVKQPEPKTVILDRPFVYMIVDAANHLPIFIGTVTSFEQ